MRFKPQLVVKKHCIVGKPFGCAAEVTGHVQEERP